jgi:integrase
MKKAAMPAPLELGLTVLPAHAGALLDPQRLGPVAEQAEAALLRQGESANTLRSYRSALRYWAAWYALRYGRALALPVPVAVVRQFIVDHAQRLDEDGRLVSELPAAVDAALVAGGYKAKTGAPALATLLHRVAVLSKAHQLDGRPNPCGEPRVRELLAGTRRGYAKRGDAVAQKPALTREPLEALLATCDESLVGLRDRALLLFAFASGGRRRSEVTAATLENTRREADGYRFTLSHSKTNQAGADRADNDKPVVGRAAAALSAWLAGSGIRSGPIFRRVRRGGVVGEPLSPSAVRDIVRRRCALAGLEGNYSAHSLRSGFVTEAGRQRMPLGDTMALTGHRSTASLVGYFRQEAARNAAARLLEALPPERDGG